MKSRLLICLLIIIIPLAGCTTRTSPVHPNFNIVMTYKSENTCYVNGLYLRIEVKEIIVLKETLMTVLEVSIMKNTGVDLSNCKYGVNLRLLFGFTRTILFLSIKRVTTITPLNLKVSSNLMVAFLNNNFPLFLK